jgi:hypothetical protein
MDTSFNSIINNGISSVSQGFPTTIVGGANIFYAPPTSTSPYIQGCASLVNGLFSSIGSSNELVAERGRKFLSDLIGQDQPAGILSNFKVVFHPGDILSILINFTPYNGDGNPIIGSNPVYKRSYKVMLICH